jgi:hypothetical protein
LGGRRPQPRTPGLGGVLPLRQLVEAVVAIDSYVNDRLARLTSIKLGLSGRNWVTRFSYQWASQLGIYRLRGTVRYWTAHA